MADLIALPGAQPEIEARLTAEAGDLLEQLAAVMSPSDELHEVVKGEVGAPGIDVGLLALGIAV
jgi:hypothetical protein